MSRALTGLALLALGGWTAACATRATLDDASGPALKPTVGDAPEAALPTIDGDHNLLRNGDFSSGAARPWQDGFSLPAKGGGRIVDGTYCVRLDAIGEMPWDALLRQRYLTIQKGHQYVLRFTARASQTTRIRPVVAMMGPPYAEYFASIVELSPAPQQFVGHFEMGHDDDPRAELAFHFGGGLASGPVDVCIDDVALDDPSYTPPVGQGRALAVRVNQLGYLPGLTKIATVEHASEAPLAWTLVDSGGAVIAAGDTSVHGRDSASGDHVHLVDISAVTAIGRGYVLVVDGQRSQPFDIDSSIYRQLKYDALWYFFHNRSGIALELPHAGEARWARPAGHLSDKRVACMPGLTCDYQLDVSGGWYDAGDHGKYVVNGGISVWTLLNQHERLVHVGRSAADFGDGKLRLPEVDNGVSDLLDEARWELEFLLKMQVPSGPLAGMAHHKIHDDDWSGLGLAPHESDKKRFLHPPSTAATLNLAAVAAQAARIWTSIDPAFSARCLQAAERAWQAAEKHPRRLALPTDNKGGGAYDDKVVADERYWAAAELFVTTGKEAYREALAASKHHLTLPLTPDGSGASMNWQMTAALGTISLALVPHELGDDARKTARQSIVTAADAYLKVQAAEGYRLPFANGNKYPWGSNASVLNNAIVLALAHDFSGQQRYLDGVVLAMDYLLGRNPLAVSYITGYGESAVVNPHHRFWARAVNADYPEAPPGCVSGGPNSGLEDPIAQKELRGCAPQRCFLDHIDAWSLNEITINWNAPLAWVSAFLDEKGAP